MKNSSETFTQKPEPNKTQEEINHDAEIYIKRAKDCPVEHTEGKFSQGGYLAANIRYFKNAAAGWPDSNCPRVEFPSYSSEDYLRVARTIEELASQEGIEIEEDF